MSTKREREDTNEPVGGTRAVKQREQFSSEIELVRARADELRQRLAERGLDHDSLVLEAIEHLQTTLEELSVADEELHQQNEELIWARSALEAERQRYQDLFEFAPDAYLVTDGNGKILDANRAAAALVGVAPEFLLEKPLITYVAERDHAALRKELTRLSGSDASDMHKLDLTMTPRAGKPFYAGLRISVTRDSKGKLTTLRWLLRDITERVRAAGQIQALNAELEEKVSRRTAELEQANLLKDELLVREQRARAEAEAANRGKDEFFAIVSHELRTPLNTILGWAQMLRSDMKDRAQEARAAEIIERSAKAQAQIINDILDVSRSVTGNLRLDMRPLDLSAVVEAAIEDARPSIDAKGIHLNVEIDRSVGPVTGDSSRLQQVVGNLLSNSIKFTPPEGRIEVRLDRSGVTAQITVRDSGTGIGSDFLPHIFDRFSQADSTSTRRQSGLGLGLAIVRLLVEMHGGTVQAASDGEGKGSTFTVTLPAPVDHSGEAPASDSEVKNGQGGPETLQGLWVLVVDDDSDAQEMMRAVLEGAGARVTTCGTCEEAIDLFSSKSTASLTPSLPNVLVADIAMPGQDGFDLIRTLRMLGPEQGGTIPAIALTAYTGEEAREQALANGYQMHLTKPMHLEELVNAIARLSGPSS